MTILNIGRGGKRDCDGLADVALMMNRGNDTANTLALMTSEFGSAVRKVSGRPNPMKYGHLVSMKAILWCTGQPSCIHLYSKQ
jgi:hypothetical protein